MGFSYIENLIIALNSQIKYKAILFYSFAQIIFQFIIDIYYAYFQVNQRRLDYIQQCWLFETVHGKKWILFKL